ncbi:hypothetical protein R3P38DRAFT_3226609 [Favolaschia claudopus]|uniref:F-box domain-containing protein n=1 Tax=Favolaschia claudopus TaxID=2862362 RepID=A0AAV9ZTE6_9AGAR
MSILTFPFEIASAVFVHCVLNENPLPSLCVDAAPVLFLQVCREWRTVAQSSPELWNLLQIDFSERLVALFASWLTRALSQSTTSFTPKVPPTAFSTYFVRDALPKPDAQMSLQVSAAFAGRKTIKSTHYRIDETHSNTIPAPSSLQPRHNRARSRLSLDYLNVLPAILFTAVMDFEVALNCHRKALRDYSTEYHRVHHASDVDAIIEKPPSQSEEPGSVYWHRYTHLDGTVEYKAGRSNDPERRLEQWREQCYNCHIEPLAVIETMHSHKLESVVHKWFKVVGAWIIAFECTMAWAQRKVHN